MVIGDTGEGDDPQYAVVPGFLKASQDTAFTVVASDVIYPVGTADRLRDEVLPPLPGLSGAHLRDTRQPRLVRGSRRFHARLLRRRARAARTEGAAPADACLVALAAVAPAQPVRRRTPGQGTASCAPRRSNRPCSRARTGRSTRDRYASSVSTRACWARSTPSRAPGCARWRRGPHRRSSSPARPCTWTASITRARSRAVARSTTSSAIRPIASSPR